MRYASIFLLILTYSTLSSQTTAIPYRETFDTLLVPFLPRGWSTSVNRKSTGDIVPGEGGSYSDPIALLSVNATIEQWIEFPPFDLSEYRDLMLSWMERRSASHDAILQVEVSVDGGLSYHALPEGVLPPTGSTEYITRTVRLGRDVEGVNSVLMRLKADGNGSGRTGTLRIDDVALEGRARYDIAAGPARVKTPHPREGGPVEIACTFRNTGYERIGESLIEVYTDHDGDRIPRSGELRSSFTRESIPPGDTVGCTVTLTDAGRYPGVLFIALSPGDQNHANDTAYVTVPAGPPPGVIVINEIMYDPIPGRAEYVELINASDREIDMSSWRLTDTGDDTTTGGFGPEVGILGPGEMAICSPDSSVRSDYTGIFPGIILLQGLRGLTLNNGGDMLQLLDATGFIIDSLIYRPQWHTPVVVETSGRSLERIDPRSPGTEGWNWGTSADPSGGTPGRKNSLTAGNIQDSGDLFCSPNPFSPDGDGFEDVTYIHYVHPGPSAMIRVRIYNTDGWLLRTLTAGSYVPGEGVLIWNGFDDKGRKAPIGIYVLFLEGVEGDGVNVFTMKGVVVVAGTM